MSHSERIISLVSKLMSSHFFFNTTILQVLSFNGGCAESERPQGMNFSGKVFESDACAIRQSPQSLSRSRIC